MFFGKTLLYDNLKHTTCSFKTDVKIIVGQTISISFVSFKSCFVIEKNKYEDYFYYSNNIE